MPGSTSLRAVAVAVAIACLIMVMLHALATGAVHVSSSDVLSVVLRRLSLGDHTVTALDDQIVWQLRLPRVLGAAAVGAALATVGAVLQSVTRNDLADPYLFGISGGAAVGAVSVIVMGITFAGYTGNAAVAVASFVGAMIALVLVLALATGPDGELPPARTILAGVAVGQAAAAITSFIVIVSGDREAARQVLSWTLGSMAGLRWPSALFLVAVAVVSVLVMVMCSSTLDAFAFGENAARSLGVRVERVRWMLLSLTALVTACMVAFVGAIGFVGLVVPHMVRFMAGPKHPFLLPMSALIGAVVLVVADTVARSFSGGEEIPIGVVTGVIGAPFFAWLLRRERRRV